MREDVLYCRVRKLPGFREYHWAVRECLSMWTCFKQGDPAYGWAWRSVANLASDLDLSQRTVIRATKWLEDNHILVACRSLRHDGHRNVNRYWMLGCEVPVGGLGDQPVTLQSDQNGRSKVTVCQSPDVLQDYLHKDFDAGAPGPKLVPPAVPSQPLSWPASFAKDWTEGFHESRSNRPDPGIGLIAVGRVGKALKPLVDQFGVEAVREWWRYYIANAGYLRFGEFDFEREPDTSGMSPEKFAATYVRWKTDCEPLRLTHPETTPVIATPVAVSRR